MSFAPIVSQVARETIMILQEFMKFVVQNRWVYDYCISSYTETVDSYSWSEANWEIISNSNIIIDELVSEYKYKD